MDSVEKYIQLAQKGVAEGDPVVIGVLVAILVVCLTILLLTCVGGSNKRRGVLMVGICGGGKTLLFMKLVRKKFAETVTSMTENVGPYDVKDSGKRLTMMDLPGHERSRWKFVDNNKHLARGIMYVIDSGTFQKEIKDVAEFLYSLLTDRGINNVVPPVLIVCNKQDQMLAKGAKVIQTQLEKEMNTLRVTRSATLESTDGSSNNNIFLGKRGKDFSFADLKPFKVTFCESSARGKEDDDTDLSQIEDWLQNIA